MEAAQEELQVSQKPKEIHTPSEIKDPWELMAQFYESPTYRQAFERFYKGKSLDTSVSEKEKERVFLENHAARAALIDFATTEVIFRYDPERYPPDVADAINDYIKVEKDRQKMARGKMTGDEIIALDRYRAQYHNRAAQRLVKSGIVPSMATGEALARLVLMDKGLDTSESAKEKIPDKLKRVLG